MDEGDRVRSSAESRPIFKKGRGAQAKTRSGPKIPAAGYLEGEGFFGFGDICSGFGCSIRTTKFGSRIFGLLALKMALRVNSDHRFGFFGHCSLCGHGFFTPKATFRPFLTFRDPRNSLTEDGDTLRFL